MGKFRSQIRVRLANVLQNTRISQARSEHTDARIIRVRVCVTIRVEDIFHNIQQNPKPDSPTPSRVQSVRTNFATHRRLDACTHPIISRDQARRRQFLRRQSSHLLTSFPESWGWKWKYLQARPRRRYTEPHGTVCGRRHHHKTTQTPAYNPAQTVDG